MELKPCPFCGGKAIMVTTGGMAFMSVKHKDPDTHVVTCNNSECLVRPRLLNKGYKTSADAVAAWNRRA